MPGEIIDLAATRGKPLLDRLAFNVTNPDSLIVGQTLPIKNRDVIYASRHPSVDLAKFLDFVARPIGMRVRA